MHTILPHLLRRTVKVAVVGCGGTGSAVISGLSRKPRLDMATPNRTAKNRICSKSPPANAATTLTGMMFRC